jgi:hypothetical protein
MAITISGDSPNFTSATLTTSTLTSPTITGAVVSSMASSVITSGTAVASTSGTSIDFTSIPSWVKRITVMFNGVSTNGTSNIIVQLISASGVKATGYSSTAATTAGTLATSTIGFISTGAVVAANTYRGSIVLVLQTGNEWVATGILDSSGALNTSGGGVNLAETLTGIRVTTVGGANTFDAGSINILYE